MWFSTLKCKTGLSRSACTLLTWGLQRCKDICLRNSDPGPQRGAVGLAQPALNCPALHNVTNIWVGKLSSWCLYAALGRELMVTNERAVRLKTFVT